MKIKVPSRVIEACDICANASQFLTKCVVCKREYCHTCEGIFMGCVHQPDVCKVCAKVQNVKEKIDAFADPLLKVLQQRNAALKRIKLPTVMNNQPK